MKHYFGYIQAIECFGFLDEDDERITPDLIELTEEQHQNLLQENSEGKDIILYEGEVFAAPPRQYIQEANYFIRNPYYEQEEADRQKQIQKQLLLEQIDELDKKRIRAVCEPSEKEPGLTWLEYYTAQILSLREQINNL